MFSNYVEPYALQLFKSYFKHINYRSENDERTESEYNHKAKVNVYVGGSKSCQSSG